MVELAFPDVIKNDLYNLFRTKVFELNIIKTKMEGVDILNMIKAKDNPCMVLFCAKWCQYSRIASKIWNIFAKECMTNIPIIRIEETENAPLILDHNIGTYPTIKFLPYGWYPAHKHAHTRLENFDSWEQFRASIKKTDIEYHGTIDVKSFSKFLRIVTLQTYHATKIQTCWRKYKYRQKMDLYLYPVLINIVIKYLY